VKSLYYRGSTLEVLADFCYEDTTKVKTLSRENKYHICNTLYLVQYSEAKKYTGNLYHYIIDNFL
jgi:hypothetical protein